MFSVQVLTEMRDVRNDENITQDTSWKGKENRILERSVLGSQSIQRSISKLTFVFQCRFPVRYEKQIRTFNKKIRTINLQTLTCVSYSCPSWSFETKLVRSEMFKFKHR